MSKKDWKKYSEVAFTAMNATLALWQTRDPDSQRAVTKIYYDLVFSSGFNKTGLISESAFHNHINGKGKQNDDDHLLSPQFVARMIMDMSDQYLTDYNKFEDLFRLCRQTILVTSEENHALRQLTTNNRESYIIKSPTVEKYEFLNINLLQKQTNRVDSAIEISKDKIDTIINIPHSLTEYESTFVL